MAGRKATGCAPKQPGSLVDQLEFRRISSQLPQTGGGTIQPRANMSTKAPTTMAKDHKRTSLMGEDTSKNKAPFPPIPIMGSYTPRKSKVSWPPSRQAVMQQRRRSVPEESSNRLFKPILKKRHSVSVEFKEPTPQSDQLDMSILYALPWERELYLPPISSSGTLIYLEEDGSLPPMLRRLSNADMYNYSQEFLHVLDDMKKRPPTSHHRDNNTKHK